MSNVNIFVSFGYLGTRGLKIILKRLYLGRFVVYSCLNSPSKLFSQNVHQAYSISGLRATSGPRDVADWPDSGLYPWLIQCVSVSSDLPFGNALQYN
jgi:hypothetical protein